MLEIIEPFIEFPRGSIGEASDTAMGIFQKDLDAIDDHTLNWLVIDHPSGQGVEGHLVVGVVLIKVM